MNRTIGSIITIIDDMLMFTGTQYLSGRLGILIDTLTENQYWITIISKENLHLTVERLQKLKYNLGLDPFKDMDIAVYVDEIIELRDQKLRITRLQIFVREKDKK